METQYKENSEDFGSQIKVSIKIQFWNQFSQVGFEIRKCQSDIAECAAFTPPPLPKIEPHKVCSSCCKPETWILSVSLELITVLKSESY